MMSEGFRRSYRVLLACAMISIVVLTLAWYRSESQSKLLDAKYNALLADHRKALAEVQGLVGSLGRVSLDQPFLRGVSLETGDSIGLLAPVDGLYWFMSSTCPACKIMVERLRKWRPAVGVTLVGRMDDARLFAELFDGAVPDLDAVVAASGSIVDIAPRHGTPLLVAVKGGRLIGIWTGLLSEVELNMVVDSMRRIRG